MEIVKKIKIGIVVFSSCVLFFVLLGGVYYEQNSCMGIPLMSATRLESYTEKSTVNIADIRFNGECVASDVASGTIYISQSPEMIDYGSELNGKITINNPNQKLYFLNNDQMENLRETIKNADCLTLIVIEDKSFYKVNVVITTLPILSLVGQNNGEFTEKGEFVCVGNLTVYTGEHPSTGKMSIETYPLKWHARGGKSALLAKKPTKLSLKKESGENLNADILGMGADDDWILNPMNLEDTKLREKTAIDVWNNYIKGPSDYPMSTSQYVEVVVNGGYYGLCLIQRRIDAKFLELDKERDILFKGYPTWYAGNVYQGYELVYSPYDIEKTYSILEEYLYTVDEDNYVSTNIYLDFMAAIDNTGYKNMFYVLRQEENGTYKMYFVIWDTDLSMGLVTNPGQTTHKYDYDTSIGMICRRMLYYNIMLTSPDLDEKMAERWHELSGTVFGDGGAWEQALESNKQSILDSGAFVRDNRRWGFVYGGADSMDNLFKWNKERTAQLDEYWEYK